ncbi:hypothetical protein [Flammeovirga sp. EKP202]|uniref:hypothetical protein n=1 Tax=Flammeovirga sp. EKP202 TaxID=2770592 RepID=UPI00165EC776|nr:hypothetical protein [Flammeovirga sp. EKP202]MBD0404176.1 hypothetical protein [Flammeovirga sp. EKP202]
MIDLTTNEMVQVNGGFVPILIGTLYISAEIVAITASSGFILGMAGGIAYYY